MPLSQAEPQFSDLCNKDKQILIHYAIPISSGYVKVHIITLPVESLAENPNNECKFFEWI